MTTLSRSPPEYYQEHAFSSSRTQPLASHGVVKHKTLKRSGERKQIVGEERVFDRINQLRQVHIFHGRALHPLVN